MHFILTLGDIIITLFIIFFLIALGHMQLQEWLQTRRDRKKK